MNMQQLMIQAQKMKRELEKAKDALASQEFKVSKSGAVSVVVLGDKTIKEIKIDEDALEKDNKEMLEDMLTMALNEAFQQILNAEEELNTKITGQSGGFGF